jgi:uncharacterized membrane-anchored protein
MSLKEILQKIVDDQKSIILHDGVKEWQANTLLNSLSESKLKINAYFQRGMYIAEIDPKGYLGRVLYRVKSII